MLPARFVAFVQAEPEFFPRTPHLKRIVCIRNQFDVMRVVCCDNQRQRKSVGISHQTALYALFPSVRGIAACFFVPGSGGLVIQPSIDNQDQSMPSRCSQANNPLCQKRSKTPAARHSWKRRCAELDEHVPLAFSAFLWHPVLRTKKIASTAARLSMRFRYVPSGWLVLCSGINGAIFSQSSSLIRHWLPVIFLPSEIISYDILTIPSGIGSKLEL
ncbi:Uncharacterised protein [Edwardsiella ictaluri]|nr:Uncharacterised protein [Edwardsiella ictaluri]